MEYAVDVKALKKIMVDKNFETKQALAEACHVSRDTVSSVLNGKNPSYPLMAELKKVLEMTDEQAGAIFFAAKLRFA